MKNHQLRNWQTINLLKLCFNPHTHEGCDTTTRLLHSTRYVSIHTPTKGVTFELWLNLRAFSVSIHTPTKGVTNLRQDFVILNKFQSTHPRRVWHRFCASSTEVISVSIHTPTKGVTFSAHVDLRSMFLFQSTHPRRVWRGKGGSGSIRRAVSIHTPTKGVTV